MGHREAQGSPQTMGSEVLPGAPVSAPPTSQFTLADIIGGVGGDIKKSHGGGGVAAGPC